ncbi:carboxypeptidase regulatory-like domain-containing protein [Streptomyces krungchingensis]|uniref:carboxypeptidase regulatory-like domain-containing protein n=1 Tax=Streptomyces krungchingensis TaxID=1565034 RepID=UPI003CF6A14A
MTASTTPSRRAPLATALAEALWFPAALFLGFLFCFAPALHAPQPHHAKVVVAGAATESRVDGVLRRQQPGGFDVTAVADAGKAREAVLDREAVAGYAEGDRPVLYVAKANGMSLEQALTKAFTPVAAQHGHGEKLTVVDVAPTTHKDLMGTTLVYFGIAWSIPGYILSTTLLRAVALDRRKKLSTIAGTAALFSVIGYAVGVGLGYLPHAPSTMAIAFLLTTAVATFASGLAPFAKQYFPAIGMGLFIVLSIPTSGGVAPAPLLPTFFQYVHAVMPLANAVDALRGALYFDGAGVLKPVLVLCAWTAAGVALLGLDAGRHRRAARRDAHGEPADVEEPPLEDASLEVPLPTALPVHAHHFGDPEPVLVGTVLDSRQRPVHRAVVTVMDARGRRLVSTTTDARGEYAVAGLPEGCLSVVASSAGRTPVVHRELLGAGAVLRTDFALHERGTAPRQTAGE